MIKGRFDTRGRPIIRALVKLPNRITAVPVAFVINTGSTATIIMPNDTARLQIDCGTLPPVIPILGIGGHLDAHPLPNSAITFQSEELEKFTFITELRVVDPQAHPLLKSSSILGWDVLE